MSDRNQMTIVVSKLLMDAFQKEFYFYYKILCGHVIVTCCIEELEGNLVKIVLPIKKEFIQKVRGWVNGFSVVYGGKCEVVYPVKKSLKASLINEVVLANFFKERS